MAATVTAKGAGAVVVRSGDGEVLRGDRQGRFVF